MAEELFIPKLGQTVEEVTIIGWLVEDGTKVDFGTPVLDVETDKAVFPIEANASGYLHRGPFKEGEVVSVLTVVATIGKKDEAFQSNESIKEAQQVISEPLSTPEVSSGTREERTIENEKIFISPRAKKLAFENKANLSEITATGGEGTRIVERDVISYLTRKPKVTPLAQNMAIKEGIDLQSIEGTGVRGSITKSDVEQKLKTKVTDLPSPALAGEQVALPESISNKIPLKGVRRIIFERMGESVHTTARVSLFIEIDATQFVQVREQIKTSVSEEWGFNPGYNDILALIVARCLREFPFMNARLNAQGDEIQWLSNINLGMAVDTDRGLVVPVIRNADKKGLREFGSEFRTMTERARAGRSLPDDLSEGTFTITNLGMYDIDAFTPVINLPELAILGVGRIGPKAVPIENEIKIRQMMTLSLVFDHRLVDGAPAARFLQRIKQYIETPFLLLG